MANINMADFVQIVRNNFSEDKIRTIVEVGALDGADSVYFKQCFPNASVIAYEGLEENWEVHKPTGIIWINKVISSYNGETDYHVKYFNDEMSIGIHGMYDRGQEYGTETRIVPCYRLDSLITEQIDMLKIDVEGATYDVLEGMGCLLDTVRIMHIETETISFFSGQKKLHKDVCDYLVDKGFVCLEQQGANIERGTQYDTVWINEQYLDS